MGRTNPTFRDQLRTIEDDWHLFRRVLRRQDKSRFDRLFVYARDHAEAAGNLNLSIGESVHFVGDLVDQVVDLRDLHMRANY